MAETPACALCGKDAIGFRSIGCSYLNVCMEPADSHILALRGTCNHSSRKKEGPDPPAGDGKCHRIFLEGSVTEPEPSTPYCTCIKLPEKSLVIVPMVMSPYLPVSFSSADEAILFSVVYWGWVACEFTGSMILPRLRQLRSGVKIERKDRGSGWMVITGVIASIFVAFFFSREKIAMLPGWTFYPGIALMIGGIVLRQWSIAVLGKFFSMLVSVQKGQSIIREGPYRFIRHPSYTGALLTLTGIGLAIQSWGALLVLLVIFCIVYGYRIHIEEKALIQHTGEEYTAYMQTTKMVIPYIL